MKYKLSRNRIKNYNRIKSPDFPKYTTQLINLANQNAQGTRPAVVGKMSELFQEFMQSGMDITVENWRKWYTEKYPNTAKEATAKVESHIHKLQDALSLIDHDMIADWVDDFLINKTFTGLYFQKAILASLADKRKTTYRLATPEEESIGIDGYVEDTPYSIKPNSYNYKKRDCMKQSA